MTPEERLKILLESGEYDFLKDMPIEHLWKLILMTLYIVGKDIPEISFDTTTEEIAKMKSEDAILGLLKLVMERSGE